MGYTNPVISGFHPDPSVCRVGEDYYLVTSSFEYFPGVPIFHSRDLAHWRQIGHCLTRDSQLPLHNARSSGGIYAPTLRYHAGTFYMVTTNVSGGGHFYVTTADPYGEWSEPIWLSGSTMLRGSIDPSLFFDDDGTVYFTCTGTGQKVYQFEIDIATGKALNEARLIWSGTGGKYPEGPHLYKINGWYYLMAAEGGTEYGHFEALARAAQPYGEFTPCPYNPILTHRSTEHPIQATGHADLVQAHDGSWWAVFLGARPNGYPSCYHLGRETFLSPIHWTDDGWFIFGDDGRVDMEMNVPTLPPHVWESDPPRDDFDADHLRLCWNFLRNPRSESWSLTERPGWLRLSGSPTTLDEVGSPSFLGRRQEHFRCRAETLVDFDPQGEGDEAGLTILMNERHHYEIVLILKGGERRVIVRRRIGSLSAVVADVPIERTPVRLSIQADADHYQFGYALQDGAIQVIAQGETRYLSTEVAGGFTGVYFGLYVVGVTSAYFDWFDYVPLDNA